MSPRPFRSVISVALVTALVACSPSRSSQPEATVAADAPSAFHTSSGPVSEQDVASADEVLVLVQDSGRDFSRLFKTWEFEKTDDGEEDLVRRGIFGAPARDRRPAPAKSRSPRPSSSKFEARGRLSSREMAFGSRRPPPPAAPPTQGVLRGRDADGRATAIFPLRHTDVNAEASGWLATTKVRQTFENPFQDVVEAVYVFPLPTSAAVNDFVMEIQGRRIVGVVRPRAEAAAIYAAARARGQTASLLSQERPNIFTQSVANIEPGGKVDVHITYFHTLSYAEGAYEYVFPMVVGPRYIPGIPAGGRQAASDAGQVPGGGGTSADTDQVPDASRISPPVLPPEMRSAHDVSVAVKIVAGVPVDRVESPSHEVSVFLRESGVYEVSLSGTDQIPNRDFVLRWHVAGDDVRPGFVAHRTERSGGFFSAFLVPKLDPMDVDVTPREVTFVLDTSGSMSGIPMDTSRKLAKQALEAMRPYDRFNIIRFAGSSGSMATAPVDATPENVAKGMKYLDALKGGGGTEMLSGIRAWLAQPKDPRYLRVVVFLTDGFIGNEEAIHGMIRDEGQDARWYAFGIGSSVNRHLIEGIGEAGNGATEVILPREEGAAVAAAHRLLRRFDSPLLVDVTLEANGLPVTDVYPKRIPDLFAGQPIMVTGRYTGPATGELIFRGRVGSRTVEIPMAVSFPETNEHHRALASVWGRTRIKDLSQKMLAAEGDARAAIENDVTNLAVEFSLVSRFTSFIAVDESRIVGDGKPVRILQPVELPQDVSYEGAVGPRPGSSALRVPSWGVTLVETKEGALAVAQVTAGGSAAGAGVKRGQVLASLGGHALRGARHLEALLLQTSASRIDAGFRPGTDVAAAVRTVNLPRP